MFKPCFNTTYLVVSLYDFVFNNACDEQQDGAFLKI
jgi:hypothetical protein